MGGREGRRGGRERGREGGEGEREGGREQAMATRFLKQWAGLAKSANPNLLYLPKRDSGLNLPSLSFLYKRLQVS